nr:immunoglobulin light chain junction region [Macaca mulatta]MOW37466.1 immunoglobulin light chain junction region [Macaca mulatta]MOW37881.1 immunoglobulin light chain junction region [Macaca mulatta]MOW38210.1 immunoglobulin light chain junction region [Macaca mulatta]MOW38339.1 immunoglobulin light chain junction region [Macaca mulatta]
DYYCDSWDSSETHILF